MTRKSQLDLTVSGPESWTGRPLFEFRQPQCQPSTELAKDLTLYCPPLQDQSVVQPMVSPLV